MSYQVRQWHLDLIRHPHHNFELKGNNIGKTISKNTKKLLDELFIILKKHFLINEVNIKFFITHGQDLNYATINLEDVVNKVLLSVTQINSDEVQKFLYYQLSVFLIKTLAELPFEKDIVESIISDNVYSLEKKSQEKIIAYGNIFDVIEPIEQVVPLVIQSIHNNLPCRKSKSNHQGFNVLKFLDSHKLVSIQVCDILSNFLMNSLKYLYYSKIDNPLKDEYKEKYDFLKKYIDIDGFPINDINLCIDNNEITSSKKFDTVFGTCFNKA